MYAKGAVEEPEKQRPKGDSRVLQGKCVRGEAGVGGRMFVTIREYV